MAFGPALQSRSQIGVGLVTLSLMALVVGAVTGLGAVVFRILISIFHNTIFLGQPGWFFDANLPTPPSSWGPFVILAPVVGGQIVVYFVRRFAPEAKGHGIPEVMAAIYYNNGRIRPVVVVIKALASAMSIGTGASVGREGPIVQIGSAIGSTFGQIMKLANCQVITLVAAGAGAGIAATFNTPLGAVMFAIELMLPQISVSTFLPVVIATGAATYVGRMFYGLEPAFTVPTGVMPDLLFSGAAQFLPIYVLFGILCGLAAAFFVRFLHGAEDVFNAMPYNAYVRNAIGMTALGVLMYVFFLIYGRYFTNGVGYATIQSILNGDMTLAYLMALLCLAKIFATSVSLAAGASGGVFAPSLFIGATLGGSFGAVLATLWPHLGLGPIQFAVIGMAGLVGGGTNAAMTAILMVFEMTGDYTTIVPVILAVAAAVGTRRILMEDTIYTMKLVRRGQHIPKERHSHMFTIRKVSDIMVPVVGTVKLDALDAAIRRATDDESCVAGARYVAVEDGKGRLVGLLPVDADGAPVAGAPLIDTFTVIREGEFLQALMFRMARKKATVAIVLKDKHKGVARAGGITGVVHRGRIADAVIKDYS